MKTYKDNHIITRALIAVAEEKGINLGGEFVPRIENVERWKKDTIVALQDSQFDLDTLKVSVLLDLMDI